MASQSLLERVLVRLYDFSWPDALVAGFVLGVIGLLLVALFGPGSVPGYAGNFILSLGLFSLLFGALWGVAVLLYGFLT